MKITCLKRKMSGEVEEMGEVNKEAKTNEETNVRTKQRRNRKVPKMFGEWNSRVCEN